MKVVHSLPWSEVEGRGEDLLDVGRVLTSLIDGEHARLLNVIPSRPWNWGCHACAIHRLRNTKVAKEFHLRRLQAEDLVAVHPNQQRLRDASQQTL